jgi:hypothetical protein
MIESLDIKELVYLRQLMSQMLSCAESGKWDEVSKLDSERLLFLQNGNRPGPTSPADTSANDDRVSIVNDVLELDKKIVDAALIARGQLVKESSVLRNQLKAKQNYAKASTLKLLSAAYRPEK